ncbi:hypothetical protein GCM10023314_16110 [Algibacter agarivorans]|uniref:DUF6680 domain-containing protein n=1 Tax=Algibacter agarivorans TaxID=1109741 RepID=A0ABP9GPB0_9FLAO
MDSNIIGIVSIIAILVSPLIAVQVTRYLDEKKAEKTRQMEIYRVLMGQRGLLPRTDEYLIALNQIVVVFHKAQSVLTAYKELYKSTAPNSPELSDSGRYLIILLRKMAEHLNIDNLQDLDIDNYYSPQTRADSQLLVGTYYQEFLRVLQNSEHLGKKRNDETK